MRALSLAGLAIILPFLIHAPAQAQASLTPQQIQAQIAGGQEGAALSELREIVAIHPQSGVAWYLVAEAQDASGNRDGASSALAKAEQYAPGLPFADPAKVAALRAHLAAPAPAGNTGGSSSPIVWIIVAIGLFLVARLFLRSRRRALGPSNYPGAYQGGVGPGMPGGPPGYGPGYNQGGMMGSGLGGSLLGGLAAGAGLAAGERLIDGMIGNNPTNGGLFDPAAGNTPIPDRDDGLNGTPDWNDDNQNQNDPGSFDPGNNW